MIQAASCTAAAKDSIQVTYLFAMSDSLIAKSRVHSRITSILPLEIHMARSRLGRTSACGQVSMLDVQCPKYPV